MPPNDRRIYPWAVQGQLNPLEVVSARGCWFTDSSGQAHLDLGGQLAYMNVGHGHPAVVAAIREQAGVMAVMGPNFMNQPARRLAEMLAEITPAGLDRVFFTNGGTEANEHAIRIAQTVTGRPKIVTRYQSYHGATLGSISASGDNRKHYTPTLVGGFIHALDPYEYRCRFCRAAGRCSGACGDALEEVVYNEGPESVAAILVEPITGTSGGVVPADDYLPRLRELCDRHGILLIFDEVITGFCRTGRMFASEHWQVVPDLMTFAKGVTSGYVPLGGVMMSERVAAYFDDHYFGSGLTYSAHPLACAAGCATLQVYLDEKLAERAAVTGAWLHDRLLELQRRHPSVGEVRGKGLLLAIELVKNRATREPLTPQRDEVHTAPEMAAVKKAITTARVHPLFRWNLILIAPPLVISQEELEIALEAIDRALTTADELITAPV